MSDFHDCSFTFDHSAYGHDYYEVKGNDGRLRSRPTPYGNCYLWSGEELGLPEYHSLNDRILNFVDDRNHLAAQLNNFRAYADYLWTQTGGRALRYGDWADQRGQ